MQRMRPRPRTRKGPPVSDDTPKVAAREPLKPGEGGLSRDAYEGTTQGAADSTSVIPAVRDDAPGQAQTASPAENAGKHESAASGRSATLRLSYIEPWSVTRMAFVVSVALMIVNVVAVAVAWFVLQITGVWGAFNDSITNLLSDDAGSFDIGDYLGFGRIVGITLILSALNVIFMSALATIAAQLYNLAAKILGGVRVSFSDD